MASLITVSGSFAVYANEPNLGFSLINRETGVLLEGQCLGSRPNQKDTRGDCRASQHQRWCVWFEAKQHTASSF